MTKPNCKFILAHIALSSTLFVAPLAMATTFGPGIVAGPISTSTQADNTIEVLATGAIINAGGNAINLDSFAGTVITDPLNTLLGAGSILSTGGAGRGILISANQGTVDIGTSSGVRSTANHGIEITGQDSQLFLSGFVTSSAAASAIFNTGANTMITNNSGAVIAQSVSTTNPTLLSSGNNFSLYNAGTITQRAVANTTPTLLINAPFNEIVNLSGGIIQNIYGAAGTAHTLQISGAATSGDIFNEAGGLIYNDGGGVAVNIGIDTNINFINAGKIENGGNTNAIIYAGNIDSFFNSGSIISRSATTIFATANVNIPGMFINNGDITNQTPGNSAIDFASFPPISITYVQDAGTVTGNVLLAQFDSQGGQNVFFMNGGTIAGSVFTFASPSTLALNGGTISGNVVGNTLADTFNLSGTMVLGTLNGGDGNDIFNITGGSYAFLDGGLGLDQVNFNNTFSSQGVISNVESVNVNTGTLTLNNNIINMGSGAGGTGLTITPGATLLLNAGISGQNNIINDGTFSTNSAQVINLSGAGVFTNENGSTLHLGSGAGLEIFTVAANGFTSLAGSTFSVDLQSATQYGHLIVNSPGAN
ncbi:MAG: beta strand repeat-containing protein, partial [Candidatus Berkiella sp.]